MESVLRGAATYLVIWFIFRLSGKRTLAQITTFDAVLLLIISETTQAALSDNDQSFTNSLLLILTLLGMDVMFSELKRKCPRLEKVMDGAPLLIYSQGALDQHAMAKERVDEQDILHAARDRHGLQTLGEIEYAILEPTGEITVIPKSNRSGVQDGTSDIQT
jgi:uncharacterized membrane protein YcaP (DUF421 family)